MATPHVAGVAALVLARNPTHSTASLRSALVDTGDVVARACRLVGDHGQWPPPQRARGGVGPSASVVYFVGAVAVGGYAGWRRWWRWVRVVSWMCRCWVVVGCRVSGVGAVVLNVTVADARVVGVCDGVAVWCGAAVGVESLNFVAGQPVANAVVAKVGAGGMVSFWNAADSPSMGSVHLLVDVVGWFAAGSSFTSLVPARLLDTRWLERRLVAVGAWWCSWRCRCWGVVGCRVGCGCGGVERDGGGCAWRRGL